MLDLSKQQKTDLQLARNLADSNLTIKQKRKLIKLINPNYEI